MPQFANSPVVNAVRAKRNNMPLLSEMARFAFVGVINTAVDLAVLNALIAISHHGRAGLVYSLFKAISFLVATLNSYWMNSRWTFRQTAAQNAAMRVGRFLSVSVLGLAINVGTASWVAFFAGPVRLLARWWPSVAALAGTACGLAVNFAGYKYLVFSPPSKAPMRFSSDALDECSDPFVPSIDDGLEHATGHPLRTVVRTPVRDRGETAPPNETHQPPARIRLG